jgi:Carboxypeptidase regulatory-like domain
MRQPKRVIFSILLPIMTILSFGFFTTITAQSGATTGSISGFVADQQGGRISGAIITVINVNTNLKRDILTTEEGSYLAQDLPPGTYKVVVEADGFKSLATTLELLLGTTIKVDFPLPLAQAAGEIIEITATSLLGEGKTESSTNQDSGRIVNLPINVRDFLEFALTSPRVTPDRLPPNGVTATSGLSFNSQSARLNNITVDGGSNNENFTGGVRSTISQEAVQEFQVVSDSYSAEFGRAVGGVINIVTKSGTNEYRGSIFNFFRNQDLAARDAFATFKPEFKQYQFGATLGGPIKKDKSFFFLSFERFTQKQNLIVTIPNNLITSIKSRGYPEVVNGPVPFSLNTSNFLARVDTQLSANNRLSVRYNGGFTYNGAFETIGAFPGGLSSPTTSGIQRLDDNSLNITDTIVTSFLVNESRFIYGRRNQRVESADEGNALVMLNTQQGQVAFGRNFAAPQNRELRIYQFVDNISISKGKNFYKFGVDFNYINTPGRKTNFPIANGGFFVFAPIDFGAAFGNPNFPVLSAEQNFDPSLRTPGQIQFLTGLSSILPNVVPGFPQLPLQFLSLPVIFAQNFGDTRQEVNIKLFSAYAQDDIKLRPNLLVKAGIRYDIFRESFVPANNGNFAPRVAFSYSPTQIKNLTVHGAYGMFFSGAPSMNTAFLASVYDNRVDKPQSLLSFLPFPFSIIPFTLPGHRFPEGPTPPPIPLQPQFRQTFQFQDDFKASYSHQVTFGFNYLPDKNTRLSVDYNYVRGVRLLSARFINPVVRPIPNNPTLSSLTGRVNPNKGFVFEIESAFDSYYNGLTISLERRLVKRVSFIASYTFSKAIDNYQDFRTDQEGASDPLRPGDERGLSIQDVRSRFVGSGLWDLSYTNNPFLRGFRLAAIAQLASGTPFSPFTGADTNMNFETVPADRPPFVGRNTGIRPGFATIDLRFSRTETFGDHYKIEGIFEVFNLFNRTNIQSVNNLYPQATDGSFTLPPIEDGRFQITRDRFTNSFRPRQIQLGFRFTF